LSELQLFISGRVPVGNEEGGEDVLCVGLAMDTAEVVMEGEMDAGVEAAFTAAVVLAVNVVHT
jgi:hypothetical protein